MQTINVDLLSFRSGISLGPNEGKVIAQLGPSPHRDFPESYIMEWSAQKGWRTRKIQLTAIRMSTIKLPTDQLIIMGAGGYVVVISGDKTTEEMVDPTDTGPKFRGNIRDMRLIGSHLYAAGMNRQVYRRDGSNRWLHCDEGVVLPLGTLEITGFSAIDGINEKNIYAAGFNGDIWKYNGRNWRQIDSATNVILHRIRVIESNLIFAGGQKGVLLKGSEHEWHPVMHDITSDDLWGMEWFRGRLYVSTDYAIYVLDGEQLEAVNTGLGDSFTYRHLHASNGAMWSFGPKHIAKTDGKKWIDVSPR
mgnify:CR=1 FL=1